MQLFSTSLEGIVGACIIYSFLLLCGYRSYIWYLVLKLSLDWWIIGLTFDVIVLYTKGDMSRFMPHYVKKTEISNDYSVDKQKMFSFFVPIIRALKTVGATVCMCFYVTDFKFCLHICVILFRSAFQNFNDIE